jgi:hypothetical protein
MKEAITEYFTIFLSWLKDNHFHQYKDGTWYTTQERPYTEGKQRKFYTDDEIVELFLNNN